MGKSAKPTAISLFSGCGGSDVGLRKAGFSVTLANDIWKPATDVYKLNHPSTAVVCADIKTIDSFPYVDLLVGCYPCQGFSQGGKRDPSAEINGLYRDFARALGIVKPQAFIVENVIGMTYGRNKEILRNQIEAFTDQGYDVRWKAVDARNYGLAQERKRVFLVGHRTQLGVVYEFPPETHGSTTSRPWASQQSVLSQFPEWPEGTFDPQPLSWYYMSRRRRRDWNEPAPCVVANSRHVGLHPISPVMERIGPDQYRFQTDGPARRYSYLECAALQGFPSRYKWGTASLRQKYRMIGNAVPPKLFEIVSDSVRRTI